MTRTRAGKCRMSVEMASRPASAALGSERRHGTIGGTAFASVRTPSNDPSKILLRLAAKSAKLRANPAMTIEAPALRDTNPAASGEAWADQSDRIVVLDVLRGIALLGMFFVHFHDRAIEPIGGLGLAYRRFVLLFFETQFWTIFAILFGAGFAVQLRRADSGGAFIPRYGRRLFFLAVFGFIAEVGFGYAVLLSYAVWGVPLLLVRRWSNRALLIALIVCAASIPLRSLTTAAYFEAVGSPERFNAGRRAAADNLAAARKDVQTARSASDYGTVVSGRLRFMPHFYSQGFSILPTGTFTLFLIGLLAFRLGLFNEPHRHRRIIAAVMIFGALSWAIDKWLLPLAITPTSRLLSLRVATLTANNGFGLIRDNWLALTYIGMVLLLVSRPAWQHRLSPFSITGRMALTNYMSQVVILDLTFSNYAFGAQINALFAPLAALALFALEVTLSRWWLSRFYYGPLEWLWRSATYARWQPLRIDAGRFDHFVGVSR